MDYLAFYPYLCFVDLINLILKHKYNMTKTQIILTPADTAFNKLYFVNMFQPVGAKFATFNHAEMLSNRMAKIATKLSPSDLQYLISKIESIQ